MDSDGGSTGTLLRCPRDGAETRLRCPECATPVCPACFVRTAVGFKCPTCAATPGARVYGIGGGRRTPLIAAVAVVALLAAAGVIWAATRHSGGPATPGDVDGASGKIVVPEVVLGTGDLPGGATWKLVARRDGEVCTTLTVTPGPPVAERCGPPSTHPVDNLSTRVIRGPAGTTTYLMVGEVSDRAERVRVAPDGAAPWEVETLGGGTGLDARFFVAQMNSNAAVSLTLLAADGTDLGRVTRPALPTS